MTLTPHDHRFRRGITEHALYVGGFDCDAMRICFPPIIVSRCSAGATREGFVQIASPNAQSRCLR